MAYIRLKSLLTNLNVRNKDFPVSNNIVNVPDAYIDEVLASQPGSELITGDPYQPEAPKLMTDGRNHR